MSSSLPRPDRAGDGQDEVRLVAMTAEQRDALAAAADRLEGYAFDASALDALADSYEDGITEDEARLLRTLGPCHTIEECDARDKLRSAFPTQKDSGDG